MDLPLGSVPVSTIDTADNILITEGTATRKVPYTDFENALVGSETLTTTSQSVKGAINELDTDIDLKANNTDNTRTTTAKDVTGAINEVNASLINLATQKIDKTSIVNNLTATLTGFVLDATQGKSLKDEIDTKAYKPSTLTYKLYVPDDCNFNIFLETGIYQIGDSSNMTNKPTVCSWSILEVLATNSYIKQTITNTADAKIWVRTRTESAWSSWRQL